MKTKSYREWYKNTRSERTDSSDETEVQATNLVDDVVAGEKRRGRDLR